jgi:predicted DNA binding CopG/RHH family protein
MVKKRPPLSDAVAQNMADRTIGSPSTGSETQEVTQITQKTTKETQEKTKGYKCNIVSIRFDSGDYERLKEIAQEQGTNGAALIRKAVKNIIRTYA